MVSWKLHAGSHVSNKPSVAAVSYLNTVPLVWGFLHGPQRDRFLLDFYVPSECAQRLETGKADLGILPVVEMQRQRLVAIPGTGIACRGAVRSILLISKVDPAEIRTLATDSGSRTSVQLARVILHHRYDAQPQLLRMAPNLTQMLSEADAALLIGDAALRVEPSHLPYAVLDLGQEWWNLTGLPMVFALWSGHPTTVERLMDQGAEQSFRDSLAFGLAHIDEIVAAESARRPFSPALVRNYLTESIVFNIGAEEQKGLETFLQHVAELNYDYAGAGSRPLSK
ncbi:MAG: menaquinone biosynthesis protein [Bryobacterales bacterium]|nr:menaquinone biosynthesis protein [Bryobacterales bacterium]